MSSDTLPPFYRVLRQPAQVATLPPKPAELTTSQSDIYHNLLNHLSRTDYRLPITLSDFFKPPSSSSNLLPLSDRERAYCSREFILRTCRATRWDQSACIRRLEETLVWRRDFGVDDIDLAIISKESETGKQFVLGYDVHSRPCLHMYPYRQNTKPSVDQIKFVVWCLERTIDLMPPGTESLTLLIDFGSSKVPGASGQPTTLSQAKQVLHILQTYYCERLGRAICINVPWVFWGFYKLVKPFMDPRTVEKIKFNPDVTELVPPEQLEKRCFGGELEFEYDHDTYFPLLVGLTDKRRERILARYRREPPGSIGLSEFQLRGGKTDLSADEDSNASSTDVTEPELERNGGPRRPILRHHAETDAGDSVLSDHPPRGSSIGEDEPKAGEHDQVASLNQRPPTSTDLRPNTPDLPPSTTTHPRLVTPDPPRSSINTSSSEALQPRSLNDTSSSEAPNEDTVHTNLHDSHDGAQQENHKMGSTKIDLSKKFGSIRQSLAFHFKNHSDDLGDMSGGQNLREKKNKKNKQNKTINHGIVVEADEFGRPQTDQVGASRRISRILAAK